MKTTNYYFDLQAINLEDRLYVLKCGSGFTCLGFDVCETRTRKLIKEMGGTHNPQAIGTADHYYTYRILCEYAQAKNQATGWRSTSELNPKLIGLEGKRIEATVYGERIRFIVGKSTGFIPCHLEIKTKRSHGGSGLPSDPDKIKDIKIVRP